MSAEFSSACVVLYLLGLSGHELKKQKISDTKIIIIIINTAFRTAGKLAALKALLSHSTHATYSSG